MESFEKYCKSYEVLKERLKQSRFRSRFRLKQKDLEYVKQKGHETIYSHALDFIQKRLSTAFPLNDGKQTPMKGHPVFIAQHATATCCRGCIEKWHGIRRGKSLTENEILYIAAIIVFWIQEQ